MFFTFYVVCNLRTYEKSHLKTNSQESFQRIIPKNFVNNLLSLAYIICSITAGCRKKHLPGKMLDFRRINERESCEFKNDSIQSIAYAAIIRIINSKF